MHDIEPYYNWRHYYVAAEDEHSPFYGENYDEFYFTKKIYNYFIHPQWDSVDSPTTYLKVLYANYDRGFSVIEFIGEWNDCISNDIMIIKRNILEAMMEKGINKFVFIMENVLNFHASDELYYEELSEEIMDMEGWVCLLNLQEHVEREMRRGNLHYYLTFGGCLNDFNWRALKPIHVFDKISFILNDEPELLNQSYD